MKANLQQIKAINHGTGPCVVTSVPGSGKTTTLTQRAIKLYKDGNSKILCLTFTNKAADEMQSRISKELGMAKAPFAICTFHALCAVLLRKFGKVMGYSPSLTILDSDDQKTFIKKIIRSIVDDKQKEKDIDINKIVYHLNLARESYESDEQIMLRFEESFDDDLYWDIAKLYLEEIVKCNCIDFSGMIYSTIKLLENNPSVLKVIQNKWDYIQVDECQDTNYSQFKLLELISQSHNNVFIVGDISQCVQEGTLVKTQNGDIPIEKIQVGDMVLSAVGSGKIVSKKVINKYVHRKKLRRLVKIVTSSGKTMTCTEHHVVFADFIQKDSDQNLVYLMYRQDLGYRLGISKLYNKNNSDNRKGYANRCLAEKADKVWILKIVESEKEARYNEQLYSVKYGIPTWTFVDNVKKGNAYSQEHIKKLFSELDTGRNVDKLFKDLNINKEFCHYYPKCMSSKRRRNFVITLCDRPGEKTSQHRYSISGSDDSDRESLKSLGLSVRNAKKRGWRIESLTPDFEKISSIYKKIKNHFDINLIEKARLSDISLPFIPASNLRKGMNIFTLNDNNEVSTEEITDIKFEYVETRLYDIDIENVHNYISNNIVSHNSVYLFRNARYQNIIDFISKHKDCANIPLGQNYRSTPEIVKAANTLIKHNKSHVDVNFYTENPSGHDVSVISHLNSNQEANTIAGMIYSDIYSRGYRPQEIAVLYRMNSLSIEMQLALSNFGINFSVIGGGNYFQLKEIKDSLAMVKFLLNNQDSLSFHRCADLIPGAGASTIGKLENLSKEKSLSILDTARLIENGELESDKRTKVFANQVSSLWKNDFKNNSPDSILVEMMKRFEYEKYLNKHFNSNFNKKRDNLQALVNHAASYSKTTSTDASKWLNTIMLTSDSDKESKENCVNLMTLHASKGLEFPVVYMAGVEIGILPHKRAIMEAKDANEALEEERRICYVGMTRAEKKLVMSYCNNRLKRDSSGFLKEEKTGPSQFLKECGLL